MNKVNEAVEYFNKGFNCSQAIFSTYGPEFGLEKETALKIATPFGGGISQMGETCGAVTGALMVIGLKYGRIAIEDTESKEKTYEIVHELVKRFNERHGSIKCKDILGYDLNTPDGKKKVSEQGLTKTLCPVFVKDTAEILEEIL